MAHRPRRERLAVSARVASTASIEQCDGKLPVKMARVDVDAADAAAHAELRRRTSRGPACGGGAIPSRPSTCPGRCTCPG